MSIHLAKGHRVPLHLSVKFAPNLSHVPPVDNPGTSWFAASWLPTYEGIALLFPESCSLKLSYDQYVTEQI